MQFNQKQHKTKPEAATGKRMTTLIPLFEFTGEGVYGVRSNPVTGLVFPSGCGECKVWLVKTVRLIETNLSASFLAVS